MIASRAPEGLPLHRPRNRRTQIEPSRLGALLFGGFLAFLPHRFMHPFKGKAAPHSEWLVMIMRVAGVAVGFGGLRLIFASAWILIGHLLLP